MDPKPLVRDDEVPDGIPDVTEESPELPEERGTEVEERVEFDVEVAEVEAIVSPDDELALLVAAVCPKALARLMPVLLPVELPARGALEPRLDPVELLDEL